MSGGHRAGYEYHTTAANHGYEESGWRLGSFISTATPTSWSERLLGGGRASVFRSVSPHRYMVVAAFTALCICACTQLPPPIARDLPAGSVPDGAFDLQVKSRFPVGSGESNLVAELRLERFEVRYSSPRSSATRDIGGIPCRRTWTISWTAPGGKIADVAGNYREICL